MPWKECHRARRQAPRPLDAPRGGVARTRAWRRKAEADAVRFLVAQRLLQSGSGGLEGQPTSSSVAA